MHSYIQISKINDYLFCPRSVYLHSVYEGFDRSVYHSRYQTAGTIAHKTIDKNRYSSLKRYLVGAPVYSEQYEIAGKIDIYDRETKTLIERKKFIQYVYDGQRYQLYAQMICMIEMGYEVSQLLIHSLDDNKKYPVSLPDKKEMEIFLKVVKDMKDPENIAYHQLQSNLKKCMRCIYQPLCRGDL
jgi:CRISPR-associated exonuclease Cas4